MSPASSSYLISKLGMYDVQIYSPLSMFDGHPPQYRVELVSMLVEATEQILPCQERQHPQFVKQQEKQRHGPQQQPEKMHGQHQRPPQVPFGNSSARRARASRPRLPPTSSTLSLSEKDNGGRRGQKRGRPKRRQVRRQRRRRRRLPGISSITPTAPPLAIKLEPPIAPREMSFPMLGRPTSASSGALNIPIGQTKWMDQKNNS